MRVTLMFLLLCLGCAARSVRHWEGLETPEYGEQCAEARRQARDSVVPPGYQTPTLLRVVVPPMPVPEKLKKSRVTIGFAVDSAGNIDLQNTTITGIGDRAYVSRLRRQFRDYEFYPARVGRCGVRGRYQMVIDL
jgi:hypothetical protein